MPVIDRPRTRQWSLGTLEEAGLIREVSAPDDEAEDERKVWYGLTPAGRRRLAEEADTLARWAELARGAGPA